MAALPPVPPALWVLVGLMVLIEVAIDIGDSGLFGRPVWRFVAVAYGGFFNPLFSGTAPELWPGQSYAMLLTHAFLHGDFVHLALNMVVLLAVGKVVAALIGPLRMLLLFALCAILGALAFGMLSSAHAPMIGASGAVFGFIAFWKQAEFQRRRRLGMSFRPILGLIIALALANVMLLAVFNIAWEAHFGGFVAGWVMGVVWRPVTDPDAALPGVPPGSPLRRREG